MRVIAADPVHDDAFASAHGVSYVPLEQLLGEADVVSLNCSLNDTTRGMLGAEKLALLKKGALFINTARGGIVDEAALADALRAGSIRAAGIDVFEHEPPVGSPLLGLPNVVLSPHAAAYTEEAMIAANIQAATTIVNYMRGRLPEPDCIVVAPNAATAR
jgi:D-3-phosphoglycerate dehydrogenase